MSQELLEHESLPMYAVSEELAPRVEKFGLEQNLIDLRERGYTVLTDVDLDLTRRIRDTILRLARGKDLDRIDGFGGIQPMLLGVDPVFSEAVLYPPLLTLAEVMTGRSCILSQLAGSIKRTGDNPLFLHADQNWLPAPFPEHNVLLTGCWVTDEFSQEHGSTMVIPGSHRRRRHPSMDEIAKCDGAIAVVAPVGSIVCWDGSIWHGNYERTLPGERVVLHVSYSRLAYTPIEDYRHLGADFLALNPPEMTTLLGRELAFGTATSERFVDMEKFYRMCLDARR